MKKIIKEDGPSVSGLGGLLRPHFTPRGSGSHPIGGIETGGIRGFNLGDAISSPKGPYDYIDDEEDIDPNDEVDFEMDVIHMNTKMPMDGFRSANDSLSKHMSANTNKYSFFTAGNLPINAGHQINGEALLESYIRELIYENSVARGMNPGIGGYSSFSYGSYQSDMQLGKGKNRLGGLDRLNVTPMASQGGMQHTYGRDKVRTGDDWGRGRRRLRTKKAMPDNYDEVNDAWKKEHGMGLTSYQLAQISNIDNDYQHVNDIHKYEDEIKSKNVEKPKKKKK